MENTNLAQQPNGSSESWHNELDQLMETMQIDCRMELGPLERQRWHQCLTDYSIAEIAAACYSLVLHPPSDWTGVPQWGDIARQVESSRERRAEQFERKKSQELQAEMRDLKRRAAAGEKFYGLEDLAKEDVFKKLLEAKAMPAAAPEAVEEEPK
jgi:DNA-binding transcriptional MerR regulator